MPSINYAYREIDCKVVYYGCGMSGKTTNLQIIHERAPKETKGELISLATQTDRTLFFDLLPLDLGTVKGMTTRFQLYTVPGQVYYNATRRLVLRGSDGVVFVVDSQKEKMDENIESFANLEENLAQYGVSLDTISLVLQYNKRDLPSAVSVEELQKVINKRNWPYFEAVAIDGIGVFSTLKAISGAILDKINRGQRAEPVVSAPASPTPEIAYEIILVKIPNDQVRQACAQKLAQIFKSDIQKALGVVDKAPVIISKRASEKVAVNIKESLERIGAQALIRPARGIAPKPITPPEEVITRLERITVVDGKFYEVTLGRTEDANLQQTSAQKLADLAKIEIDRARQLVSKAPLVIHKRASAKMAVGLRNEFEKLGAKIVLKQLED